MPAVYVDQFTLAILIGSHQPGGVMQVLGWFQVSGRFFLSLTTAGGEQGDEEESEYEL